MAVKIRLTRVGKKRQPAYRVVVADSRSPRDGRYIEQIGRYDPTVEPSVVVIDNERAQYWLSNGAQPSSQVKKLLEISGTLEPRPVKERKVKVAPAPTPVVEPVAVAEPVAEETPIAEPAAEAVEEPDAESAPEPAAEAVVEPAAEADDKVLDMAEPATEESEPAATEEETS
jgi:small subunit ribosomal protein S16